MKPDDPYSRVDYRRLIAWPTRVEREWPFLHRVLGDAGRILDLGCGTGEHSRFLAAKGFDVIGIDSSPAMFAKATDTPVPSNLHFIQGDITEVESLVAEPCDGAICLGNTLPHLNEPGALARLLSGLRRRLRPGAPCLLQTLNYDKVIETGQRSLPVTVSRAENEEGEVVFLRLMTPRADGSVVFTPSTLRYRPDGDPPLEVVNTRNVMLRGWRRRDLDDALAEAGFSSREFFGTVGDAPYVALESSDIVIVAR